MDVMATNAQTPTSVQVMAALLRIKADKRLNRETPAEIKAIAAKQSELAQSA